MVGRTVQVSTCVFQEILALCDIYKVIFNIPVYPPLFLSLSPPCIYVRTCRMFLLVWLDRLLQVWGWEEDRWPESCGGCGKGKDCQELEATSTR